jgi:hypothetical protein
MALEPPLNEQPRHLTHAFVFVEGLRVLNRVLNMS